MDVIGYLRKTIDGEISKFKEKIVQKQIELEFLGDFSLERGTFCVKIKPCYPRLGFPENCTEIEHTGSLKDAIAMAEGDLEKRNDDCGDRPLVGKYDVMVKLVDSFYTIPLDYYKEYTNIDLESASSI